MKIFSISIILIFPFLLSQSDPQLSSQIVIDGATGWPIKIVITGVVPEGGAWLGISLYPVNTENAETDGTHKVIRLEQGSFHQEFNISGDFMNGSYEAAIWKKQVDKVDCTLDYCYWCKKNGSHLEDLHAYSSGLLTQLKGY